MTLSVEAILAVVFGISGSIVALLGVAFTYMAMKQHHRGQQQQSHDIESQHLLSRYSFYSHPMRRYPASANLSNFESSVLYRTPTSFGYFHAQGVPDVYLLSGNPLIDVGDYKGNRTQLVRVDSRNRRPLR